MAITDADFHTLMADKARAEQARDQYAAKIDLVGDALPKLLIAHHRLPYTGEHACPSLGYRVDNFDHGFPCTCGVVAHNALVRELADALGVTL